MDWYIIICTYVLVIYEITRTIFGNNTCVTKNLATYYGKKSYTGIVLSQVWPIGITMCLNACDKTWNCTHINYNGCDLTCDLMMAADADGVFDESVPSSEMILAVLNNDIKVRNLKSERSVALHEKWSSKRYLKRTSNYIIHVKLEKFKRGRSPSLHLAKEEDFARNHSATLILSINIQIPAEILQMMGYSFLKIYHMIHNILLLYFVDTLLTQKCIFIAKFNTIHYFEGDNDR